MYNSFGLLLHELDQAEAGLEQATNDHLIGGDKSQSDGFIRFKTILSPCQFSAMKIH